MGQASKSVWCVIRFFTFCNLLQMAGTWLENATRYSLMGKTGKCPRLEISDNQEDRETPTTYSEVDR